MHRYRVHSGQGKHGKPGKSQKSQKKSYEFQTNLINPKKIP